MTRYWTNLADIADATGFPVTEVAGWQTRGDGGMADRPLSVVCHHTVDNPPADMPSLNVVTFGKPGLENALCNFGLGRSGRIYVVAAGQAWHAGVVNSTTFLNVNAFGIEGANTGTGEPWGADQMDSYTRLCAGLCRAFDIPAGNVRGHKEICSPPGRKIDPVGIDMNQFRERVVALLAGTGGNDVFDKAAQDFLNTKFGVLDKNESARFAALQAVVAAEGTSPAELDAALQRLAGSLGDEIAAKVNAMSGGGSGGVDAGVVKQAVKDALREGIGAA